MAAILIPNGRACILAGPANGENGDGYVVDNVESLCEVYGRSISGSDLVRSEIGQRRRQPLAARRAR